MKVLHIRISKQEYYYSFMNLQERITINTINKEMMLFQILTKLNAELFQWHSNSYNINRIFNKIRAYVPVYKMHIAWSADIKMED